MRKCPRAPSRAPRRAPRRAQGFLDSQVLCCDPLDGFRAGLRGPTMLRKVRPTKRSAAQTLSFSTMSTFFGSAERRSGSIRLVDPRAPNCLDILVLRDRIERDCSWVARQVSDISATTSSSAPAICWRRLRSVVVSDLCRARGAWPKDALALHRRGSAVAEEKGQVLATLGRRVSSAH